jgi:GTPase SAR1 family protein
MPPPEFPNAPESTIVVMGDAGSGKSSLIDAAIVDAARRHAMREPPPSSPFHHPLRTGSGRVALPSGRSDIWGRHEIRKVHDLRSVDVSIPRQSRGL